MARVANFNPGPSALPLPALELARDELLDFEGSGMSILEHSHRGKVYEKVHAEAIALLRRLWRVPDSHDVLFLQGGASQQFAWVPMNLLPPGKSADYAVTGVWAEKALAEAKLVGTARAAADTRNAASPWNPRGTQVRYDRVPAQHELALDPQAAYFHYTSNNTVMGTQYAYVPDTGSVPLIVDMSSDILSYPLDVARFGLIYAGAQKNVGPSGITIVIVQKELVAAGRTDIPKIFRYATHAKDNSLYHTIPTFGVYLVRNVLRWLEAQGGVAAIAEVNRRKAALVYGAIDDSDGFYTCPVEAGSRSVMNPVWYLPTAELDAEFVSEAERAGMVGLKGHRSVGGIRASLYNAVSLADTEKLVGFMREFRARHG
jgi:phosphoserine aminotransferase